MVEFLFLHGLPCICDLIRRGKKNHSKWSSKTFFPFWWKIGCAKLSTPSIPSFEIVFLSVF
jgi:hypothetical protein